MPGLNELLAYQGNPGLAGGQGTGTTPGVANFDRVLDSVDRFTAYTMQVNRDLWVQGNLEMQKTANEASKQLSVTYGNLIPEDREQVDNVVQELYSFYNKNPNAVRYMTDPIDPSKNNRKDYGEFLALRQKLDRTIVRGNIRANQLAEIDKVRSTITDPSKLDQYDKIVGSERKKPIEENLLIPPDIAPFNWSSYVESKTLQGQRQFDYLQRFPNDILTVTKNLFDPFAASAMVATDLNNPSPLSEELKKNLALQFMAINSVVDRHKITDAAGNVTLDRKGLEADSDARPFLDQINIFNQHVKVLNNTDMVEGGKPTNMKVRQFLGYSQELPTIDVQKLSDMDLVRMAMTYKMGISTAIKPQQTDNAIQRRGQDLNFQLGEDRLKFDKDQFWFNIKQGKEQEQSIADEKIMSWYNLMQTPVASDKGQEVLETSKNKSGKVVGQRSLGYEVAITPQLASIFSIPVNKSKVTTKETSGAGAYTNQGFTSSVDETTAKRPYRIFVVPDASGNPNKNKVNVRYDDNSVQSFTSPQVFTAFNKLYGEDSKVQSKVSEVSIRRLAEWGLTQPDVQAVGKQLGNLNIAQTNPNITPTTSTGQQQQQQAPQQTGKKKPRPY